MPVMADVATTEIRPTMATRPLAISAAGVRPNCRGGMKPYGSSSFSPSRRVSESPSTCGPKAAANENASACTCAIMIMARSLDM
eukprot:scaffold17876_cov132-Isochrysis_galbana.AAC.4